jgi:PAS domain S-box-containing protein
LTAEGQRPGAAIGTPIQQLDVASIVKASQAVSSEIELPKLIGRLMTLALENAGADRGLLILPVEGDYSIQAEAKAAGEKIEVALCKMEIAGITCPESLLRYVIRTQENVLLDDASRPNLFSEDDYLRGRKSTSILCLPLIKQGQLTGLLYLENTLTSHAFTPDRIAVLELLAAQAAISLENTRLYSDLQEREAKVRRLVDSNIIGVLILDHPEGRILEANEAFLHMVGYSRADLVSGRLNRTALTPNEWSDATDRAQVELRTTGSCKAFEKEYFRKDGTRVPVLVGGTLLGEGRDKGVAFVLDLTERKRAEAALKERAQLLDLTHDTIFVRSMNDVISFWNRGAEHLYGWTKEEALGRIAHQLLRTSFLAPLEEITAELLSTGRWEGELVHTKRDGTQVSVASRWSLQEDERGRPVGILETNNDITERKRAEYLTSHVFERSPDSICIVGKDYRLQRVNPVFEQLWGPATVVVGMHLAEVIGTELFERNSKPSLDRCFTGEEVSIADWYVTARGRRYSVITHSPLRRDQQRVEAALMIGRDFTDHVLASEALRAAQMELAHVNRVTTMGQLTASIAHEVNQPIAGIMTSGQAALNWLAKETPDVEAARQSIERLIRDAGRAGSVIDRIRDLIKKAPRRSDRFNITEAIGEVIELTRGEAVKDGVSLQTQLATSLPLIEGDRVELQQVILNLIINAIQAMSGTSEAVREVLIATSRAEPDSVLVAVKDSGPGLAPASADNIFEPFYTTKPGGLGMGLSICRSIIEAHGGQLWLSANVSRGAVFQFTIPGRRSDS